MSIKNMPLSGGECRRSGSKRKENRTRKLAKRWGSAKPPCESIWIPFWQGRVGGIRRSDALECTNHDHCLADHVCQGHGGSRRGEQRVIRRQLVAVTILHDNTMGFECKAEIRNALWLYIRSRCHLFRRAPGVQGVQDAGFNRATQQRERPRAGDPTVQLLAGLAQTSKVLGQACGCGTRTGQRTITGR